MKETVEEAAEKQYAEQSRAFENDTSNPIFDESRYLVAGFLDGAKWQSEQDNWISVEERLPTEKDADENGKVLVCHKSMSGEKWNKFFADWDMISYLTKVEIYWKPLPHPPKVKETEK